MVENGKESLERHSISPAMDAAATIVDFKLARRALLAVPDERGPFRARGVRALAILKERQLSSLSFTDRDLAVNMARHELNRLDGLS